jgi:ATP-dependent RNA helicase DeaD
MGSSGVAISLVAEMEKFKLQSIARFYNINMEERQLASDEELERVVAERITALLESRLHDRDTLQVERMQRFLPLARNLAQSDDELALIAMLLDDYYQQSLHAIPVQPMVGTDEDDIPRPKPKLKMTRPRPRNKH